MTNTPIDRKAFQQVKNATEQNERLLGRTIITTVATCATVVGWMIFANTTPAPVANISPSDLPANSAPVEVAMNYAPIPTVYALPNLAPLPPLDQHQRTRIAPIAVSNSMVAPVSVVAPAPVVQAHAPVAQPVLRVVARPVAPAIPVAKTGGSK